MNNSTSDRFASFAREVQPPTKETYIHVKRPTKETYIRVKRPTKETYMYFILQDTRNNSTPDSFGPQVCWGGAASYKRDLCIRNETFKRDLHEKGFTLARFGSKVSWGGAVSYTRDLYIWKETCKRDLYINKAQKRPIWKGLHSCKILLKAFDIVCCCTRHIWLETKKMKVITGRI